MLGVQHSAQALGFRAEGVGAWPLAAICISPSTHVCYASLGSLKMISYTVVLEHEEDGRYSVYIPDLPGCASMGKTKRQAMANIREALVCYLEGLRKLKRPLPKPRASFETLRISARAA